MLREVVLNAILSNRLKTDEVFSKDLKTVLNRTIYLTFGCFTDTSQLDVIIRRYHYDHTVRILHFSRLEYLEHVETHYTGCSNV